MEKAFNLFVGIGITIYLLSFFAKNIITAKRTGQPIKGKSWKVKVLVPTIGILYTLTYLCIFLNHDFLLNIDFLDIPAIKMTGIGLIVISIIIGISTLITMKNSWRMGIAEEQNTELIINGFFKYSRNPYFLSYYLVFFGVFLVFPTVVFILFYIPFAVITHLMIFDEEKFLEKQHGNAYLDYKKTANRYIPIKIKNN